jgi:hypothetical protein
MYENVEVDLVRLHTGMPKKLPASHYKEQISSTIITCIR